jgi:hypothetical protein
MQSTSSPLSKYFHCSLARAMWLRRTFASSSNKTGKLTRYRLTAGVRDQRRETVRVNEFLDRFSIFDAIEWRDVHQKTSDE